MAQWAWLPTFFALVAARSCPGEVPVLGYGPQDMSNAYWNVPGELAGPVEVVNGSIVAYMKGRTYFSSECFGDSFNPQLYSAINFLGKRFSWTMDLSGAGCGCNAALYLTSLHQNTEISGCDDYYCDANSVCGVRCAEIDLAEANMYAWHSTLHVEDDRSGVGGGYGGGGSNWHGPRDWTKEQYGPNGNCVDTTRPFQVAVGFPVSNDGQLVAMTIELSQAAAGAQPCTLKTEVQASSYTFGGRSSSEITQELTEAFAAGMTPIVSYWSSNDMLWMDGRGNDGLGPCDSDDASACGESVSFYDFSLEPLQEHLTVYP